MTDNDSDRIAALEATIARVEALAEEWEADEGRTWIGSLGEELRAALGSTAAGEGGDT